MEKEVYETGENTNRLGFLEGLAKHVGISSLVEFVIEKRVYPLSSKEVYDFTLSDPDNSLGWSTLGSFGMEINEASRVLFDVRGKLNKEEKEEIKNNLANAVAEYRAYISRLEGAHRVGRPEAERNESIKKTVEVIKEKRLNFNLKEFIGKWQQE